MDQFANAVGADFYLVTASRSLMLPIRSSHEPSVGEEVKLGKAKYTVVSKGFMLLDAEDPRRGRFVTAIMLEPHEPG